MTDFATDIRSSKVITKTLEVVLNNSFNHLVTFISSFDVFGV